MQIAPQPAAGAALLTTGTVSGQTQQQMTVGGAGNAAGGFAGALYSFMSMGSAGQAAATGEGTQPGIALLPVLDLLQTADPNAAELAFAQISQQLEALLGQLQQMDPQTAESWLKQDDVQSLLAELGKLLEEPNLDPAGIAPIAVQDELPQAEEQETGDPAEELTEPLDPMLFMPIAIAAVEAGDNGSDNLLTDSATRAVNDIRDAQRLIREAQLRLQAAAANTSVLPEQAGDIAKPLAAALQTAMQRIMESASQGAANRLADQAALASEAAQPAETSPIQPAQALKRADSAAKEPLVAVLAKPVSASSASQLELLAVRSAFVPPAITDPQEEAPLFQPLDSGQAEQGEPAAVPIHEVLRQMSSGQWTGKTPVLRMPAPTFTEDFARFVVQSFSLKTNADGVTEAKISLYPQHLGQVEVKLSMHNGQLVAQFVADSLTGKEMLESQLAQLRTTLQNQGIQVEKLDVTQSSSLQSGLFQEGRQQQPQQPGKQRKSSGNEAVTLDEIRAEDIGQEPGRRPSVQAGSIDLMA